MHHWCLNSPCMPSTLENVTFKISEKWPRSKGYPCLDSFYFQLPGCFTCGMEPTEFHIPRGGNGLKRNFSKGEDEGLFQLRF